MTSIRNVGVFVGCVAVIGHSIVIQMERAECGFVKRVAGRFEMTWTAMRAMALDMLLRWFAKKAWELAQDMVNLVAQRDDLTGEQKFKLAKEMLLDKMKEMGLEMRGSGVNWVLESAVQYWKYRTKS